MIKEVVITDGFLKSTAFRKYKIKEDEYVLVYLYDPSDVPELGDITVSFCYSKSTSRPFILLNKNWREVYDEDALEFALWSALGYYVYSNTSEELKNKFGRAQLNYEGETIDITADSYADSFAVYCCNECGKPQYISSFVESLFGILEDAYSYYGTCEENEKQFIKISIARIYNRVYCLYYKTPNATQEVLRNRISKYAEFLGLIV